MGDENHRPCRFVVGAPLGFTGDQLGDQRHAAGGHVDPDASDQALQVGSVLTWLGGEGLPGQDVAEFYGIRKYVPPLRISSGDAETPHPLFISYTEIENMRNFPSVLAEGEEVIASEKIHGKTIASTKSSRPIDRRPRR